MQRFIFQTPVINRDGLYSYQRLTTEQARSWLREGEDPLFRLPLITSVVETLTGRVLPHRPEERCYLHTGDEALIVRFDFPEVRHTPGYQRGQVAMRARPLSLADLEHIQFGLLRKFARLDSYTRSVTQWDSAFRQRRWRYLVHDAVLGQHGVYQFGRIDVAEAVAWLNEDRYESQLRYDATCKALELLSPDCDITLWDSNTRASLSMEAGDQALVAFIHTPGAERPKPFEPFRGDLSREYVLSHIGLGLLTRLSSEFLEVNARTFPTATLLPGDVHVR